jgi:hypothetical protein
MRLVRRIPRYKAKISGYQSGAGVQPNVVAVNRN